MSDDTISRAAAISVIAKWMLEYGGEGEERERNALKQAAEEIKKLPSAQPEHLTDDDFETIRIHLNAYKGKLCNQNRREEAEEYQRIIDRFMAFASAQTEIILCKDCKWYEGDIMANPWGVCCHPGWVDSNSGHEVAERGWCYRAERREG